MDKIGDFSLPFIVYKDKYRLPIMTTVDFIEEFQEMEVREDDVFLVTYPKSGTHWMQELVHLIFAGGDADKITSNERRPVVEMANVNKPELVAKSEPIFRLMKDLPSPRLFTTHVPCALLPKQIWRKKCKVIYVYRHPKDVIVSYYNFSLKLFEKFAGVIVPDTPKFFNTCFYSALVGDIDYGSWFDHILEYYPHRDEDSFLFVSYEEMKKDITSIIKRVSGFLGRDIDKETIQRVIDGSSFSAMKKSFEKDHRANVAQRGEEMPLDMFLNTGKTDQWKTRFTKKQNDEFEAVFQRKMKNCELTRGYALVDI